MQAIYAVSPAVKASAPLVAQPVDSGLGVCTLKRGTRVVKQGIEYKVSKVSSAGVVTLAHLCGGFAMLTHVRACKVAA